VAERGVRPAGQDRRHPAPAHGQDAVADGVDAVVHAMQPAGRDAVRDGLLREPHLTKLARRDDAVLARRERPDLAIERGWDQFVKPCLSF
jgi:hypothetical protein